MASEADRQTDCMIFSVHYGAKEILAVLGCCVAWIGCYLPTFLVNLKSSGLLGLLDP